MELRQLRYLVAIADEGQFTRAAAREHVAQPALSQQIARLESTVGSKLVVRSPRHSALTQAGEILVQRARRALAELDAARSDLDELAGLRRGRIVIGAIQTMGPIDLPGLLTCFHRDHPGVELAVREEISEQLAALVRSDQIDLAFLSLTGGFSEEGLGLLTVGERRLVVLLPPGHRLAGRKRVRFEELAAEQFLSFGEGAALRHILFETAAEAGFVPRVAVESNEIPRIREMVANGLGVALLPAEEVGESGPEVSVAATLPRAAMNVTLCWRAGRHLSPAATGFLEMARAGRG